MAPLGRENIMANTFEALIDTYYNGIMSLLQNKIDSGTKYGIESYGRDTLWSRGLVIYEVKGDEPLYKDGGFIFTLTLNPDPNNLVVKIDGVYSVDRRIRSSDSKTINANGSYSVFAKMILKMVQDLKARAK